MGMPPTSKYPECPVQELFISSIFLSTLPSILHRADSQNGYQSSFINATFSLYTEAGELNMSISQFTWIKNLSELIYKTGIDSHRHRKQIYGCQRESGVEGG